MTPVQHTEPAIVPRRLPGWLQCLLVIVLMTGAKAALTPFNPLNNDVTFLAWTAEQVLGAPVYGRDIFDVNPPLSFMLYSPAAFLAPWTGYDPAIRLSVILLSALSIAAFWHAANREMRVALSIVLALFFVLAFPNHFAQREQIAFLLCAPYVAGRGKGRGWAVLIGLMAGIGFMIKPHFLIPLAMLFAYRRRIGTEEIMIAATGIAYAVSLAMFFQLYLFEVVPAASATYWAIHYPLRSLVLPAITILGAALSLFAAGARQPSAMPYLLATIGFTVSALLQQKGFAYHFIPAWGFLVLYLAAMRFNAKSSAGRFAGLFLLAVAAILGASVYIWHLERQEFETLFKEVRSEIDHSRSFASLVPHPYPGFPNGFYSSSRFQGIAIAQMFISAVAAHALGKVSGDPSTAERLALDQAKRELARKPELVFAWVEDHPIVGDEPFDIIAWLNKDEEFRELWKDYVHTRNIGGYRVFRRK